jgi:dienelactone hydrolase
VLRKLLIVGVTTLGLLAVAVAITFAVQYRLDDHAIVLPRPRGPHPVGRTIVDWKDGRRNREVMVFLWYPAVDGARGQRCEYLPGRTQRALPIPSKRLQEIGVSAIRDVPPAPGLMMPVLILLPGLGRLPAQYTTIAEDLASYGYLVAGVTPTDTSRPNLKDRAVAQRLVQSWGDDASFAMERLMLDERFASHLQEKRAGIFGHSFGGNVALHVIANDPAFTRAANLDGSLFGEPIGATTKPRLILCADSIDDEWEGLCTSGAATCAAFPKALHLDFSDAAVLPSRFPIPRSRLLLGDVNGPEFLHEVSDRLRAFFDIMRLHE